MFIFPLPGDTGKGKTLSAFGKKNYTSGDETSHTFERQRIVSSSRKLVWPEGQIVFLLPSSPGSRKDKILCVLCASVVNLFFCVIYVNKRHRIYGDYR